MTEKQKMHIQDMRLQGMTYSQISNSLSMSVNTVKSFCQRNSISTSNKMRCAGNKEKCKHCGKQLIQSAKGKARTFCCDQCRYAWWNRHRHQPNRKASYRLRRATKHNKNAVPWNSHAIPARELSRVFYELMGWQRDWKYKVTANYFTKADEQVIIFDLNCCEFRFRDSKRGDKPIRAIPSEWISEFGDGLPEYMMLCRRALANGLDKWDIDAAASAVEAFDFKPLSRSEVEKRIAEMREHDG